MRSNLIAILISLSVFASAFATSPSKADLDFFDAYMNGFLEISQDGKNFQNFLPCRNVLSRENANVRRFIDFFNIGLKNITYEYAVEWFNSTNFVLDGFGDVLSNCLPAFKEIDTYVDQFRNFINTDPNAVLNFIINSIKTNYLEFLKEALVTWDLTSNYYSDRRFFYFHIAGRFSAFVYNKLRYNPQFKKFLKN